MRKRAPPFWYVFSAKLEAVADTESDVTPVEIEVAREKVQTRTDVERELDRNGAEFEVQTTLYRDAQCKVVVVGVLIVPVSQVDTKTGIPAEGTEAPACKFASPLVYTSEAESGVTIVRVPAEVELELVAAETVLPRELSVVALAAANTDTEVVLCVCSHRKCEYCYEC